MSSFYSILDSYEKNGWIPTKYRHVMAHLYDSYQKALYKEPSLQKEAENIFLTFLDLVKQQILNPYSFSPYHEQILAPFNYYQYGLDFLRPLVRMDQSTLNGKEEIQKIEEQLRSNENVILLANHQIEGDPQAISLLLEKEFPMLGQQMIFVAGERVVTDPLASPFSMGRNLLCIYSKRYIDFPPELKTKKQLHNKKTMELMSELLSEGGKCIYVAPSGGRDRIGSSGKVELAPFDPQSIEMFYLMAKKAHTPTHFYPLSLSTYDVLPPPQTIQIELGEMRSAQRVGIHATFGKEFNMEYFPGSDFSDKHARRQAKADAIFSLVQQEYLKFPHSGAHP